MKSTFASRHRIPYKSDRFLGVLFDSEEFSSLTLGSVDTSSAKLIGIASVCGITATLLPKTVTKAILRGGFFADTDHLAIKRVNISTTICRCSAVPAKGSSVAKGLSNTAWMALNINLASSFETTLKVFV